MRVQGDRQGGLVVAVGQATLAEFEELVWE